MYAFQGATLQVTDCACTDEVHPIPPTAISVATIPTNLPRTFEVPAGHDASAAGPLTRAREDPFLPRLDASSEAATQAPNASFQMLRYDLFMHFSSIVQDARSLAPRQAGSMDGICHRTFRNNCKTFFSIAIKRKHFLADLKRLRRNATGVWWIHVIAALQQLNIFIGLAWRVVM
nr:hypothetical protein [Variovorax beijingensis]